MSTTIILKTPVQFGDRTITEITLRKGRIGDGKGLKVENATVDALTLIASRLSGEPVKVIELLDIDDAEEVMSAAGDFFVKCLGGGKTQSQP